MAVKKKKIKVDKEEAAQRVKKIWPILVKAYPEATTALSFRNPLELLIATILSAQCTDVQVNMVNQVVIKKYKSAEDWAKADIEEIDTDIRSTGFYHNKAVSVKGACSAIIERFGKPRRGGDPVSPGIYLKWPWPIERAHILPVARIREITLGHRGEDAEHEHEEKQVILWTEKHHAKEELFLVAHRGEERERAPLIPDTSARI